MTEASNQRPINHDKVISVEELKRIFLFGLNLTDDNGTPFPEEMFELAILSAQEWFEKEVPGIMLNQKDIENEKHDYTATDYMNFSFLRLFRYPAISVAKVSIQFPLNSNVVEFDPTWFRIESVSSQVNLVPTQGTFAQILMNAGGSFLPLLYGGQSYLPHIWNVSYRAGFKNTEVPALIKHVVGMKASIDALNIAGDLIVGAGIASKSLSLDGLSQSIGTTSSATNAGYGARIINYNKEIDDKMKGIRAYYTGIQMVVS